MKKMALAVLLFVGLQTLAQKSADRSEILKLLEAQRQAWNDGNLEKYMQGYLRSDSLLFVGKNGPTYGWQNTLDNYKKGYPDQSAMGFLTFGIKKIQFIDAQNAFVLGSWHLKREKDEPKGYFTLWLKKVNKVWRVIVDHSS